jgi:acid phosphatase type 7
MRTSEKILLAFITLGIVGLGSFVGLKYYEKSIGINSAAISKNQDSSQQLSQENPLNVSGTPYYSALAKKNNPSLNNKSIPAPNVNSDVDNNNNQSQIDGLASNSNNNAAITDLASSNSNSHSLEKASVQPNSVQSNSNIKKSPSDTFSFAIIGDTQGFNASDSNDSFKLAVGNISKANPELVMTEGDLIPSCDGSSKCIQKYDSWKQIMQPILNKTKEVQGNHDRLGKEAADKIWQDEFDLPTNGPAGYSELVYSFDYANSHFVVLDSEKPSEHIIGQDQRDWLEKDLSATQKTNIFVFFHEPAFPVSSKIEESLDVKPADRDALWNILKNHHVTAVFSGHEHIMSRKNADGIYQFVIGNTNSFDHDLPKPGMADYSYKGHHFAMVNVNGQEITVKIYKTEGSLLDTFKIPR